MIYRLTGWEGGTSLVQRHPPCPSLLSHGEPNVERPNAKSALLKKMRYTPSQSSRVPILQRATATAITPNMFLKLEAHWKLTSFWAGGGNLVCVSRRLQPRLCDCHCLSPTQVQGPRPGDCSFASAATAMALLGEGLGSLECVVCQTGYKDSRFGGRPATSSIVRSAA